jgi:predicted lipid-binding transport protein (Tim44 family)
MNGEINLLTLLTLVVAIVAIVKLRSVLGKRTGDEETRIEERRREAEKLAKTASSGATAENVVTLPRRGREDVPSDVITENSVEEAEERIKEIAGTNTALENGMLEILKVDQDFDPEHFLSGARQAYEMIVTAFAEGNRKMLSDLLSTDVFDSFSRAIQDREGRGEIIDQSFVGISKADMLEAELTSKGVASITVRFVSQLITATRDKSGEVIDGDQARVKDVTDIWTFARDISTRDARRQLNWKLVGTQSTN